MFPAAMSTVADVTDVVMPGLTDDMESGTIIAWLAHDGAPVEAGAELLEVETDKATVTVSSQAGGVLQIVAPVGATAAVGEVIARLGGDAAPNPDQAPAAPPPAPAEVPVAAAPAPAPMPAPAAAEGAAPLAGVRASPVAGRMARQHGVDLTVLAGSGPGGRIVRADVERAAGVTPAPSAPSRPVSADAPTAIKSPSPAPAVRSTTAKGAITRQEPTRLQQVVARRMSQAKAGAPEFVIGVDVDMEEAVALRGQLKVLAGEGRPPSFNDFIVKASALALREFPRANGAYVDGAFELYERVNVGIAVAAADALVVPTIEDADRKSLGEIGRQAVRLADAARNQTATLEELSGGTFTVSNLGMYGIAEAISILNAPQAAILSVGEMKRTPVEHEGQIVLRHVLRLNLTCDHRILYGADAAGFLARIKQLLQAPLAMCL